MNMLFNGVDGAFTKQDAQISITEGTDFGKKCIDNFPLISGQGCHNHTKRGKRKPVDVIICLCHHRLRLSGCPHRRLLFLGHGCEMILSDIVHPGRTPTLRHVLAKLGSYPATLRKLYWLQSTERAIKALCYGGIDTVFNSLAHITVDDLLNHNVVFELDALSDSEAKFFVQILMSAIYLYRKAMRHRGFQHVCVIEEAHHVLRTESDAVEQKSVMDKLFREIREYGESLIVVDQMPSLILPAALANTTTQIAHSLNRDQDMMTVGASMLLSKEEQKILGRLPVGHAIVKLNNRFHAPFFVEIPRVRIESGKTPDLVIAKRMEGFFAIRKLKFPSSSQPEAISLLSRTDKREQRKPKTEKQAISTDERMFLKDIPRNPLSPTTERYKRLKLNPRKGNRIKAHLLAKRFIKEVPIPTAKGQVKLLQLTEPHIAKRSHEPKPMNGNTYPNPSLEHQYWAAYIKGVLEQNGYRVFAEHKLSSGGVVDLYAINSHKTLIVEVETGKSDVLANVEKCLANGEKRLVVAATTSATKTKIVAKLRSNGHAKDPRILIIEARYFTV